VSDDATALVRVLDTELAEFQNELSTGVVITDESELALYSELLTDVKAKAQRMEELRLSLTRPINDGLKRIRALFAPTERKIEAIETAIKAGILEYQRTREAAQATALEALRAAGTSDEVKTALDTLGTLAADGAASGVGTSMTWTFEITDPAQVPEAYKVIDTQAIRKAVSSGLREIAGVAIFKKSNVVVRKKRGRAPKAEAT